MELSIEGLAARRGGRMVFAGLSARVTAGRALVVTGPNGAGKSTLLRVLAGFLPSAAGEVRLTGAHRASLTATPGAFQEAVAYTGHLDAVKPALGVAENLALWAGLHGAPDARIGEALAHFDLTSLAARAAGDCSAGQKRRLGLARLMVASRPVWLMDEPTASLDTASARAVAALVRRHCAEGGIAVIATHLDLGLEDVVDLAIAPAGRGVPAAAQTPSLTEDPFLEGSW